MASPGSWSRSSRSFRTATHSEPSAIPAMILILAGLAPVREALHGRAGCGVTVPMMAGAHVLLGPLRVGATDPAARGRRVGDDPARPSAHAGRVPASVAWLP